MAQSTQRAVSDGTLVLLELGINYIDRDEISVFFDSIPTNTWQWVGETSHSIVFDPAVPAGVEVLVKRTTDLTKLRHAFSKGAAFTAEMLDEDLTQTLHIAQEASESNLSGQFYSDIDMHGFRIRNIGTAVDDTDALTLGQYRADVLGAGVARDTAVAAAETATARAAAALVSQLAAEAAATVAANSEAAAIAAASSAATSASAATTQAGNAATSAGSAAASASDASDSAIAAEASAVEAAASAASLDAATLMRRTSATGSAKLPAGSTAQRDTSPEPGFMRFNADLQKPEVYKAAGWGSVGGGATGGGTDEIFHENGQVVTQNYTVRAGRNAGTFGPVDIAPGVTVDIEYGAVWTIV